MIDLIIFDCDGVLIDSEVLSADAIIEELAKVGIEIDRDYVRENFLGRSWPTVAATIRREHAVPLPEDFEQRYRNILLERFTTDLRPTEGVSDMLSSLDIPFCVATSSSPTRVQRSLTMTGLSGFFEGRVFTASQVERGKPAPDLFLLAAKTLGADPARTLVIEDSLPGLQAAQAAGMRMLAYCGGAHMAGRPPAAGFDLRAFDKWTDFPHLITEIKERGEVQ
ncbi:HAD family hydrolase [Loktanella sp. IMCC34160]|uniref:HAD family hydrolase n=1 Tax=Loktanella sp. IMCC34160 TaxID=2510646 RepID=UPI00101C3D92|nr:HAD family hydrolase [Loktanella sp. IMCC34160]RYG91121.1 HAD family hydrolase [Loktanella sp. IMCC34160]